MTRPYLSASIVELEGIFAGAEGDRTLLRTLLTELDQRSTDRAGRLKAKVTAALRTVGTPRQTNTPPPRGEPEAQSSYTPPRPRPAQEKLATPPPWLTKAPRRPPPPIRDLPEDVLSAWTGLEVLSPVTYRKAADIADGDARRIATLDAGLPWRPPGEKARPNKQLFY